MAKDMDSNKWIAAMVAVFVIGLVSGFGMGGYRSMGWGGGMMGGEKKVLMMRGDDMRVRGGMMDEAEERMRGSEVGGHTMKSSMAGMMSGLQGKSGEELEKAFLDEMVIHHQGAIEMAVLVKDSQKPELKKLAEDIITAQTKEIEMMKEWRAAWYK